MALLRRRVLDYTLAGFLLLVPVLILHSSLKDPSELNGFDKAVLRISSPLQAAVSWVVEGLGGAWSHYVWLVNVDGENQKLRADNIRLRQQLAAARNKAADADVLEGLSGLRQKMDAETVGARVVGASLTPSFRVVRVRIDRGKSEVQPGMPVINADGLVGRILHAYGDYSDVLLLTDPISKIPVIAPRTGSVGSLVGIAEQSRYAGKIAHLQGDDVAVGDPVVTSGLGGGFPRGLVVGKVAKVAHPAYGLFQEVEVEPAVDFSDLGPLLVLIADPPPPDPHAGELERSASAYGTRAF